jgi:hypothetical protein
VTNSERQAEMDRARAKRLRKTGKKSGPAEPEGVVGQVKGLAASAARTVGAAVVAVTAAIHGVDPAGPSEPPAAEAGGSRATE